jgi:hypothetical protein
MCCRCIPVDGEFDQFNSASGGIEHLTLRTYGPGKYADTSPESGTNYYGGHLRLVPGNLEKAAQWKSSSPRKAR